MVKVKNGRLGISAASIPQYHAGMAMRTSTQRTFLYGFIASMCACAAVGIYVIAIGDFGRVEGQVLITALLTAGSFLLELFAAIPTTRRVWHPLGPIAMLFVPVPLLLTLYFVWGPSSWNRYGYYESYDLERWMGITWTFGIAMPLLGLLSLARLKRQFEWIRAASCCAVIALASQIILTITMEIETDDWLRAMAILSILTICGLIVVPILHRISAIPLVERVVTAKLELSLVCPRCGKSQNLAAGGANCAECDLRINIDIEEEACRKCGYPLYRIDSAACPECGTPIAVSKPEALANL